MTSTGGRRAAWTRRRSDWGHPLTIVVALALAAGFLVLAAPPIIRFAAFLFAGGVWRDLLGAALVSLFVGLALAVVVGSFDPPASRGAAAAPAADRSRGPLWFLVCILIAIGPAACILVALIASGALVDIIDWVGDRISEVRGVQSGS
jgi:hypothetical protein